MARKSRKTDHIDVDEVLKNSNADQTTKRDNGNSVGTGGFESRETGNDKEECVQPFSGFRAGLYARLSLESEANRERNTIENQMSLLRSFAAAKKDIEVANEYFDISKTGTDFDRPGFMEMLQDIREGRINCVIVKDLSRKIKSAKRSRWEKGECVIASPAYGLMKDPEDKHRIVPDREVSENVVKIFELFILHKNYSKVARIITEKGILCPRAYNTLKRTGKLPEDMGVKWNAMSVREVLKNRYYIGDSVNGKTESYKFREKKREIRKKEDWVITLNTHEAIVPKELYEQAQAIIADNKEKHDNPSKKGEHTVAHLNLLKGRIFCAECGRKMYLRKQIKVRPQYLCGGSVSYLRTCKSGHYIMLEDVENAVMRVIHSHIVTCIDRIELLRRLNGKQESKNAYDRIGKEISRINRELDHLKNHRQTLYEDYIIQLINAEQYAEYMEYDRANEDRLAEKLSELKEHQKTYDRNYHINDEWERIIETYKNKRKLTKEIAEAFVERVEVHADKSLEIRLKYDDILKELVEITENRGEADG